MAKADAEDTPQWHYSEEARAELKKHIERVAARRREHREFNWDELWNDLETTARAYTWSVRWLAAQPSHSPGNTLAELDETRALIDGLLRKLNAPAAFNWNFASFTGHFTKYESPISRELIEELTALRDKLVADTADLREFLSGQGASAYNAHVCAAELKRIVLKIGLEFLGPKIGRSDGPLITFLHLALLPVLGDATPDADALRAFARRHSRSARPS